MHDTSGEEHFQDKNDKETYGASSSKTIGDSIYSIDEDGRLTILASGQHPVVNVPGDALELLQWL